MCMAPRIAMHDGISIGLLGAPPAFTSLINNQPRLPP